MDRRSFLAALAGAAAAAPLASSSAMAASDRRTGVQLYTLRTLMERDFEGTLARVAEIGYREVEFAGYFGRTPAQVRAALASAGLSAPAAHVGLGAVRGDWERTVDAAAEIGHRYLIVAWVPEAERTEGGYRRVAEDLNRAGEAARRAGIRAGYHNHDFEFSPDGCDRPYDLLLAETDPSVVVHEMDLYWITFAGADPLDYFARFPGRFELVHVKDMTAGREMTEVGSGVIDFPRIFARARQAGIRHAFVEHDSPAAPLESIRASHRAMQRLEIPA